MEEYITLSIDTCIGAGSMALFDSSGLIGGLRSMRTDGRRTDPAQAMQSVLSEAGLSPESIKRIVVTRGPGSFSGVRSGLSFVKGFIRSRSASVVACTVFEAFLGAAGSENEAVHVGLFAGREEVAVQSFNREGMADKFLEVGSFSVLSYGELANSIREKGVGLWMFENRLVETGLTMNLQNTIPELNLVVPELSVAELAMSFCAAQPAGETTSSLEAVYTREFRIGVPAK